MVIILLIVLHLFYSSIYAMQEVPSLYDVYRLQEYALSSEGPNEKRVPIYSFGRIHIDTGSSPRLLRTWSLTTGAAVFVHLQYRNSDRQDAFLAHHLTAIEAGFLLQKGMADYFPPADLAVRLKKMSITVVIDEPDKVEHAVVVDKGRAILSKIITQLSNKYAQQWGIRHSTHLLYKKPFSFNYMQKDVGLVLEVGKINKVAPIVRRNFGIQRECSSAETVANSQVKK
jgi:hypothetical protein